VKKIESYRFGHVVIDGMSYRKDVLIIGDTVHSPWWRSAGGHVFAVEDLRMILDAAPANVVLGIGYFGRVNVPETSLQALHKLKCSVFVERSGRAVEVFNGLVDNGGEVSAALHLTC